MDGNKQSSSKRRLHVAVLASPGMGHLIPVLALGNRLATHHGVKVTVLVITTLTCSPAWLAEEGMKLLDMVKIPPVDISHLVNPSTNMFTQLLVAVHEALPSVRTAISGLQTRPDALVVDLFSTGALPIAEELRIPKYVYVPTSAWFTAWSLYFPVLDKTTEGEYQTGPVHIPGCKPVRPEDLSDFMLDRGDENYSWYVRMGLEFALHDGILVNTWKELEHEALGALRGTGNGTLSTVLEVPPVYAVGPLIRNAEPGNESNVLIKWLDMQPEGSVMYVSFGSGGTLSTEQTAELAHGLEASQVRFLWVLHAPMDSNNEDAAKSYLSSSSSTGENNSSLRSCLPQGFLKRISRVGLVVSTWAPQVEVLSHPSVGGFLSHCGWGSVLEGLVGGGVPMIAWPLYAEQRMNAALLEEELGVAVRQTKGKGVVRREEVERLVRGVMGGREGKALRDKVGKVKASGEAALSNGGSSYNSMWEFLMDIEKRLLSLKS